jgi:uncharacterized protein
MEKLVVEELYVYPIKSLGGISLETAVLEERGVRHDRRWMLRDMDGNFLTQRKLPEMALLQTEISEKGLKVRHANKHMEPLEISFEIPIPIEKRVGIWDDECLAQKVNPDADMWFSEALGFPCELVYMPEHSDRFTNSDYTFNNERVSFADAMPYLITGLNALSDLNSKSAYPVPISRFRPNIVFSGGQAFEEDNWKKIRIGNVIFHAVKPCGRCVVTTIDQETAQSGKEPLKTLSSYRFNGKSVIFGMYLTIEGKGKISVGDIIEVLEYR